MWWIRLMKIFSCWLLYRRFLGMEYLTRDSLVSILVVVAAMILSPPNFPGHLGALSPSVPMISVHRSLTIAGMWRSSPIICHWLVTHCFGAFLNFLLDIPKSRIMRQFLFFDGVHDALAINTEALSLIPHFFQQFWFNYCSMSLKSNGIIIMKSAQNWRFTFLPQVGYAATFPRPPPYLVIGVATFVSPSFLLVGVSLVQLSLHEFFGWFLRFLGAMLHLVPFLSLVQHLIKFLSHFLNKNPS